MEYLNFLSAFASVSVFCAIATGVILGLYNIAKRRARAREEYLKSFDTLVGQLTSDNKTSQLSAAVLLRRFFKITNGKEQVDLRKETINVISALLKTLRTSVFQKTLADGLAYAVDLSKTLPDGTYAVDLSECDLQKTNLQQALLDSKQYRIIMRHTDLWLADLSYANLNHITAHDIVLYESILCHASIKDCDFTHANFRGANLTGTTFKACIFKDADFTNAINVPPAIAKDLDNGIYKGDDAIDAKPETNGYKIFFSMPGMMSKEEELMTKDFQRMLEEKLHYKVIYYTKDEYPRFGQYGKVRHDIMESCAMVAFGLKQLDIHKASYRPGTEGEETWEERWLSTPWNEIEVGMGLMRGIPILLVSDPSINNGVFDKELSECFVVNISTTDDCRKLLPENEHFRNWLSMLPEKDPSL